MERLSDDELRALAAEGLSDEELDLLTDEELAFIGSIGETGETIEPSDPRFAELMKRPEVASAYKQLQTELPKGSRVLVPQPPDTYEVPRAQMGPAPPGAALALRAGAEKPPMAPDVAEQDLMSPQKPLGSWARFVGELVSLGTGDPGARVVKAGAIGGKIAEAYGMQAPAQIDPLTGKPVFRPPHGAPMRAEMGPAPAARPPRAEMGPAPPSVGKAVLGAVGDVGAYAGTFADRGADDPALAESAQRGKGIVGEVAKAVGRSYEEFATDPHGQYLRDPSEAVLNALDVFGAGAVVKGGLKGAKAAAEVSRVAGRRVVGGKAVDTVEEVVRAIERKPSLAAPAQAVMDEIEKGQAAAQEAAREADVAPDILARMEDNKRRLEELRTRTNKAAAPETEKQLAELAAGKPTAAASDPTNFREVMEWQEDAYAKVDADPALPPADKAQAKRAIDRDVQGHIRRLAEEEGGPLPPREDETVAPEELTPEERKLELALEEDRKKRTPIPREGEARPAPPDLVEIGTMQGAKGKTIRMFNTREDLADAGGKVKHSSKGGTQDITVSERTLRELGYAIPEEVPNVQQPRQDVKGAGGREPALPGFEDVAAQRAAVEAQRAREAAIPQADMPLFGERTDEAVRTEQLGRDRLDFSQRQTTLGDVANAPEEDARIAAMIAAADEEERVLREGAERRAELAAGKVTKGEKGPKTGGRPTGKALHASDLTEPADVARWVRSNGGMSAGKHSDIGGDKDTIKMLRGQGLYSKNGKSLSDYAEEMVESGIFDNDKDAKDFIMEALSNPEGMQMPYTGHASALSDDAIAAADWAHQRKQRGAIDAQMVTTLGGSVLGAAIGGTWAQARSDGDSIYPGIVGAFGGAIAGYGVSRVLSDPEIRSALKDFMSIDTGRKPWQSDPGKERSLERVFEKLILPGLSDKPMTGEAAPLIGMAAGGFIGAQVGYQSPSAGTNDLTRAALGTAGLLAGATIAGSYGKGAGDLFKGRSPKDVYLKIFTEGKGLSSAFRATRDLMLDKIAGRTQEIRDIAEGMAKLGKESGAKMDEVIRAKAAYQILTPKELNLALRWRTLMDQMALDLVEVGIADGALADAITSEIGYYVPRLYYEFEKTSEAMEVVHAWAKAHDIKRLSEMDYIMRRNDIPEAVRKAWGEIQDNPGYLIAKRGLPMASDIEFRRFTNTIAASPDWTLPKEALPISRSQFMEGKLAPRGPEEDVMIWRSIEEANADKAKHVKIDGRPGMLWNGKEYVRLSENKKLGALSGRFVEKQVADEMESTIEFAKAAPGLVDIWTGRFKGMKVGLNPATQVRNIIGNGMLTNIVGQVPMSPSGVATWAEGALDYASGGMSTKLKDPLYLEARAGGLYQGGFFPEEVMALLEAGEDTDGMWTKLQRAIVDLPVEKAGRVHQAMENLSKTVVYRQARLKFGMSPEAAVKFAKRAIFNYSEAADWVKFVRKSPFGAPFISFSYKALPRMLENAVAVGDWKKLWSFWKYPLVMGGVHEYSARQLDAVPDDDTSVLATLKRVTLGGLGFVEGDKFQKFLPDHAGRMQVLLPATDSWGRYVHADATWTAPWGDIGEVGKGVLGEKLGAMGIPFPRQLEPSNPFLQMMVGSLTGKDPFTGKDIFTPGADGATRSLDLARFTMRLWGPALTPGVGTSAEKITQAVGHRFEDRPDVPSVPMALTSELAGIVKLRPTDPRTSYSYKAMDLERTVKEIESDIYKKAKRGEVAPELEASARAIHEAIREGTPLPKRIVEKRLARAVKAHRDKYGDVEDLPETPAKLAEAIKEGRKKAKEEMDKRMGK